MATRRNLISTVPLVPLVTLVSLAGWSPAAVASTPRQAGASAPVETSFLLNAHVLDGGQQVVSLTLDTPEGIDPASLTPNSFSVRAKGVNKYRGLDPEKVAGEFDVERVVTGVHLDGDGDVVLELAHGEGVKGAQTFGWSDGENRNIMLQLSYTVRQLKPLALKDGSNLRYERFTQGALVDPEVDAFGSGTSRSGLKYRMYVPGTPRRSAGSTTVAARGRDAKVPLVVFLHGGGEGGWAKSYDNDLPLIANRGALAFATREAQATFGGAYVVAPQAFTRWLDDSEYSYTARLKSLIDEVVATKNIDPQRISIVDPSNGGYMTMKMAATYPRFFSAAVPVCGVIRVDGNRVLSDAQLRRLGSTPTWFVAASNDPVVPFAENTLAAHRLAAGSLLTTYRNVVWNGHEFDGHWSWIYVARNDPATKAGASIWEWMAAQRRA